MTSTSSAPTESAPESAPDGETVMEMLGTHVPISLIMDLAERRGPHSQEILDSEGRPESTWWVAP